MRYFIAALVLAVAAGCMAPEGTMVPPGKPILEVASERVDPIRLQDAALPVRAKENVDLATIAVNDLSQTVKEISNRDLPALEPEVQSKVATLPIVIVQSQPVVGLEKDRKVLAERAMNMQALADEAAADAKACEARRVDLLIEIWEEWCLWVKWGCSLGAVVAFVLIIWLTGSIKWARIIGGLLLIIGAIAWLIAFILMHYFIFGLIVAALVALVLLGKFTSGTLSKIANGFASPLHKVEAVLPRRASVKAKLGLTKVML